MKKTVTPERITTRWDPEALYNKATRYAQHMSAFDSGEWEYALWASFALEFLARAALANVSPALLAQTNNTWASLYDALGFTPKEEKYTPASIPVSEVFGRLTSILDNFTKEHENFCKVHTGRRNSELHSGELAFDGIRGSTWHPQFFQSCEILLGSMGMTLQDFFGDDESKIAHKLIAAAIDKNSKAARGEVEAHRKVWLAKDESDRDRLGKQAEVWATRYMGHRTKCPACNSNAIVVGESVTAPVQKLQDDEITETQEFLPNQFECIACGLKIASLSRLAAVGLGDRYKKSLVYDAAEYYAPEDMYAGYEDDNNEP